MPEFRVKFLYQHADADGGLLHLYDAAKSLEGIARALTITTHALLNGEVRTRADSAHGAELYVKAPQRGSFIYEAVIYVGGVVTSGVFYDFLKYTFKEAIGIIEDEPQNRALQRRIEPTMGELPAVLENALIDVHRPLVRSPQMTLKVTKPRGEVLVAFDENTAKALQPQHINLSDPIIGHVTRYNTISRWGRIFDYSEHRVISFFLAPNLTERERSLVTWSLHQANTNANGRLYMKGTAVVSPMQHKTKRYQITQVSDQPF
ncbi:hypothetical protein [Luteibacter sp. CQ10]|uniref:DUF7946 domain-containing protein n=1 Tax=Luteibacter sp. CQ10 TaxID=2805821 RepID=UPI0034A4D0A1